VMRKLAHCDECEHEWIAGGFPKRCARCKSRNWNSGIKPVVESLGVGGGQSNKARQEYDEAPSGGLQPTPMPLISDTVDIETAPPIDLKPCPWCGGKSVEWGPQLHCGKCMRNFAR
jgi:hypothetical protein